VWPSLIFATADMVVWLKVGVSVLVLPSIDVESIFIFIWTSSEVTTGVMSMLRPTFSYWIWGIPKPNALLTKLLAGLLLDRGAFGVPFGVTLGLTGLPTNGYEAVCIGTRWPSRIVCCSPSRTCTWVEASSFALPELWNAVTELPGSPNAIPNGPASV